MTAGTSSGQNSATQIIQQQPTSTTQLVIQQLPGQANQQQTIRKVSSSGNLATLQQKVSVLNRPGIQIVQANPHRVTKTATTINQAGASATTTATPIQFQQVIQAQQGAKLTQTSSKFFI